MKKRIKIAHSPDSDDAFMFWALKFGHVISDEFEFEIERKDIEELNQCAKEEVYDLSAISMHAYAHLADKYVLTASGASMAEKDYGPMVIAREAFGKSDLKNLTVAVPGEWTTACLMLKIIEPLVTIKVIPFEKIMPAVKNEEVDAGLLIHEGQLQYEAEGFFKVVSLIDEWKELAGSLPLPLGGNAIKKSLGDDVVKKLSKIQEESIEYALSHSEEARNYAMSFKRDLTPEEADKYLSWYANDRTRHMGDEGVAAIQKLFDLASERNLIPKNIKIEVV